VKLKRLRRRSGGTRLATGGGGGMRGMGMPIGGAGSIGGAGLVVVIAVVLISMWLSNSDGESNRAPGGTEASVDATAREFVDAVIDDVQTAWDDEFARTGREYVDTEVGLFEGSVSTGCGNATSAVGPFYCPLDNDVYLDVSFFRELENRFGAAGDFAKAYVIAHEVAHHVQHLEGTEQEVRRLSEQDPGRANELSIRLELQADCYAGFWGRSANTIGALSPGDLEEGLNAAEAIGDDRIQQSVNGRVNPETWTHGSSEQRQRWLRTGFQVGNPDACDTFGVPFGEL
jgi:predicted metalloprotease